MTHFDIRDFETTNKNVNKEDYNKLNALYNILNFFVLTNKKTLILGLGNEILTDDGIGPRLVHDLAQMIYDPNIQFDTACCGGLEIIEYIQDYEKVVFIDAIRSRDGKSGDVYYFIPSDFRETMHLSNLHDVNFLTALKLGNFLDLGLPADLHIIAVEIIEDMEFSEEFTPPLKERYPEILEEVFAFVKQITGNGRSSIPGTDLNIFCGNL